MRDRLIKLICGGMAENCGGDCVEPIGSYCPKCHNIAGELFEDGWIRLPCKVGQKIWELCEWSFKETEIREGKVSMLQQKTDKSWKVRITVNHSVYDITLDEIGKTVFLTKEEAENALKEREQR